MSFELTRSQLGRASASPRAYDPSLLFPVPRAPARAALGIDAELPLPFTGDDLWTAYEISWLDVRGKPRAAIGEISVPADSPALIESKSLKLYLNSLNSERIADAGVLRSRIVADLGYAAGSTVDLHLLDANGAGSGTLHDSDDVPAQSLDDLDIDCNLFTAPQTAFLTTMAGEPVEEILTTHLFKSNCPVTGQPDFATLWIRYRGTRVERAGLLRYLVSYREHAALHENCVEKIFVDIAARCAPTALAVAARFTRRGGLDINPRRASPGYRVIWPPRTSRQ